jgi:hypothetical protein
VNFETINNYNINYSFDFVVTLHEQICIYEKIILSAFMLIGLAFSTQAQEISKNAIGLRLGRQWGFGTEILSKSFGK